MGAPLEAPLSRQRLDLYKIVLTRDELRLLGAFVDLGADVLNVGVEVLKPDGDTQAGPKALLRFLTAFEAVPDRLATVERLAAKLDPLVAAAKGAK